MSDSKQPRQEKIKSKKTKSCKFFKTGFCRNKENCKYSHNIKHCEDWVKKEDNCTVKQCQNRHVKRCIYHTLGKCMFGKQCQFIHRKNPQDELRQELMNVKQDNLALNEAVNKLIEEVKNLKALMAQREKENFEDAVKKHEDTVEEDNDVTSLKEKVTNLKEEVTSMKEDMNQIEEFKAQIEEKTGMNKQEIKDRMLKRGELIKDLEGIVEDEVEANIGNIKEKIGKNEDKSKEIEERTKRNEEQVSSITARLDTLIHRLFSR